MSQGTGYNNFVPKGLGLVMHPAAGAVIYVISAATTRNPAKAASVCASRPGRPAAAIRDDRLRPALATPFSKSGI